MKRLTSVVALAPSCCFCLAIANPAQSPQGPAARIKIDTDRSHGRH